jgi:hypothetical protein
MAGLPLSKFLPYHASHILMPNREQTIIVNRVIREDPSKGAMHNRQPVTLKLLWRSMCDYDLW